MSGAVNLPSDAAAGGPGVSDDLDYDTPQGRARRWVVEIQEAEKWCKPWHDRARKCLRRYRDDRRNQQYGDDDTRRLDIFWSNVAVLQPALYARRPKPVVERRYRDGDPVGKIAAEVLERALSFTVDNDAFDEVIKQARDDRLIVGRGTAWVRYVPHFQQMDPPTPADGVSVTDDSAEYEAENAEPLQMQPAEVLAFEEVAFDYVAWNDFLLSPARTWREVRWVARRVQMTRAELVERFGPEIGNAVSLDARVTPGDDADRPEAKIRDGLAARANVYEIWDRAERRVCWISKGHDVPLDERDDPLRLRDFFPCPRPLFATLTTDTLLPIPDFDLYKDQADDLDDVTHRLSRLTEACRVAGVYDATQDSLGRLFEEGGDNRLILVNTWSAFSEKNGLKGTIDFIPLDNIVVTIRELTLREQALKAAIYEITGISDIVRGYSAPSETATAQQIKGQFAALRLTDQQAAVARFARDLIALAAEIISEHFRPETVALMAGVAEQGPEAQQAFMPAMALLRNDAMRAFRVEIETDSTIAVDEAADKEAATEFLTAMGSYMANALPLAQQAPELLGMIGQGALFLARRFRAGRQLEGSIEQGFGALQQRAMQMMQNPQPDPAAAKAEAEVQAIQAKTEAEIGAMQAKTQAGLQAQAIKTQGQMALQAMRAQAPGMVA